MPRLRDTIKSTKSDAEWDKLHKICLKDYEEQYSNGYQSALFAAIRYCGNEQIVMPEWAVDAFFKATNDWYHFKVKTLDEAFGLTWPEKKQFPAAKQRRELQATVYYRVKELSENMPIDETLFELVGDENNIGKTKVSEYYYSCKAWLEPKAE